ncbi:MAG: CBS domain-containing protein [Proteobacteria bacterium]|nr:CBS domain-containing protein [Pseudomonadota bacterium]
MLSLEIDKRVKGDPKRIWEILTDIEYFAEAAPNIIRIEHISGEGVGMIRRVHHNSGRSWEEICKDWKTESHFKMQVNSDDYPLPVTNMSRIIIMEKMKNSWAIKIRYDYTPKYGPFGLILDKYQLRPILKIFAIQLIDNFAKKIYQQNTTSTVTAESMLRSKDSTVYSITPNTSIYDACELLAEKRIGCVMVLDQDNNIEGILSERDIVRAMTTGGDSVMNKPSSDFMTRNVITSKPEDSLEIIMSCMSKHHFRHLPVVNEDDELLGVISIGDVVNTRMNELENESNVMQQYIEGRKWREVAMQIGHGAASKEIN